MHSLEASCRLQDFTLNISLLFLRISGTTLALKTFTRQYRIHRCYWSISFSHCTDLIEDQVFQESRRLWFFPASYSGLHERHTLHCKLANSRVFQKQSLASLNFSDGWICLHKFVNVVQPSLCPVVVFDNLGLSVVSFFSNIRNVMKCRHVDGISSFLWHVRYQRCIALKCKNAWERFLSSTKTSQRGRKERLHFSNCTDVRQFSFTQRIAEVETRDEEVTGAVMSWTVEIFRQM